MKISKFLTNFSACALIARCTACSGNGQKNAQATETEQATEVSAAMEIDELLANADALANQEIKIEGVCTHTCAHGATKIFLMGSDDTKTIRVEAAELGAFDKKCVNSIVYVEGKLVEDRIDEAALVQREEQMKEKMKEQKHGEGEGGCTTSKQAKGIKGNTIAEQNEEFRKMIKEREAKEGKAYLSFYHIDVVKYEIR